MVVGIYQKWDTMQVHVPLLMVCNDCQEFFITNSILAFGRGHFFRQECNWMQGTMAFWFYEVRMALRQNTGYNLIGSSSF